MQAKGAEVLRGGGGLETVLLLPPFLLAVANKEQKKNDEGTTSVVAWRVRTADATFRPHLCLCDLVGLKKNMRAGKGGLLFHL